MSNINRRSFLQYSAAASALGTLAASAASAEGAQPAGAQGKVYQSLLPGKPVRLGLIIGMGKNPEAAIQKIHSLGLPTCQVSAEDFSPELAARLRKALDAHHIEATSLVTGGPGPEIYDFYKGPLTIGIVPLATRAERMAHLKRASDFAKAAGIGAVQTHCGFIPADPNTDLYKGLIPALREVVSYCQKNGQHFRYETGQETPITLRRAIEDGGLKNQGVNLDTANLILYDTANPVDALDVIGPYVESVHAKDGLYPTNPRDLGKEVAIGKGKVDFRRFFAGLRKLNFKGAITIEREISGPQQTEDVKNSINYLKQILG